ncbi:Uncharacterized protein GBIM_11038 [Gryllus bimaculatus]|nr:Uncharacterized protein GBIM_11038 [Gryllus bimaculatus]
MRKHRRQSSFFTLSRFSLKNKPLLGKWLNAVKRKGLSPTDYHRLWSDHFTPSDYWIGGKRRNLKPNAVPSVFKIPKHLQYAENKVYLNIG